MSFIRVPGVVGALAFSLFLLAGCGRDEASQTPEAPAPKQKMPVRAETFRKPAEYMKDPAFQKAVTAGRAAVDEAVAFRDALAAKARAQIALMKQKLGKATEKELLAALQGDAEWKNLQGKLADAETVVREKREKLYAAVREGMKKRAGEKKGVSK